jgi:mono/diheme cytochrome c family protein
MLSKHNISKIVILSLSVLLFSALLIGCGTGGGGGDGTTTSDLALEAVGITECYMCHADGMLEQYMGNNIFSAWLNGPHGNYEGLYHSDHGTENEGFPNYGYHGLGTEPDCTTECHDQLGDGALLEAFYEETGIDALGIVNRPIVGCESCHGSGSEHFGIGDIEYPVPGPEICGQCHNEEFDHQEYHPEGGNIYEYYASSPHANSINSHTYEGDSTTDIRARCSKCHTDEGAWLYRDVSGGHDELVDSLPSDLPPVEDASPVQCRTCHDAHNPDELLLGEGADDLGNTLSAEYRTCTNCHQVEDGYHGENSSYSWSGSEVGIGNFDSSSIIYDTHFDDPGTPEVDVYEPVEGTGGIEGYVLDPSNERVCRDCHNPHSVDNTINEQWAHSGHGGHIAQTIDETAGLANVTESVSGAWTHYVWTYAGDPNDPDDTGRQSCQRCHTATGFRNLADDPENYDADGDGVPDTPNEFTATGGQAEMLYCWACHTSNAGDLRDPGLFVNTSSYSAPSDRIAAVSDIAGSNICMSCHSGTVSGQEVKDLDFATQISGESFGSFNSHYLAAGGILFRTVGYEFDGLDYDNYSFFIHDNIGTSTVSDTGENGPCVGCHMQGEEGHTFEVVETDSNGAVTEITSYEATCSHCHTAYDELVATLNELEDGYDAALANIADHLAVDGIYYGSGYPYFFSDPDPNNQNFFTWFTAWPDKDTVGAAYNLNMLVHIPGAYAHNSLYTRRLIYDSIDFLDDGVLNSSVEATLGGSGAAYEFLAGTRP